MGKGIRLSPKHGVNPSLDVCFWCGAHKGVVLCGRMHEKKGDRTDVEAPKEMVTSLDPCDSCKKQFAKGVLVIEVSDDGSRYGGNTAFALKSGGAVHWPTGRHAVIRPEAVRNGHAGMHMLCDRECMDVLFRKGKGDGE